MRVSPALLASLSLVAIASLPSRATELSETVNSSDNNFNVAEATSQISLAQLLDGLPADSGNEPPTIELPLPAAEPVEGTPIETEIEAETDAETEITQPDAEAQEAVEDALPDSQPDSQSDSQSEQIPVPAAPNQATPSESGTEDPAEEEADAEETRVLVSEVDVVSTDTQRPLTDELVDAVYRAVSTTPGRTTTRSQLQEDINSVFGTGFFPTLEPAPKTPLWASKSPFSLSQIQF